MSTVSEGCAALVLLAVLYPLNAQETPAQAILDLAAQEPLLLSIDTRLRLAKSLDAADPDAAAQVFGDVQHMIRSDPEGVLEARFAQQVTEVILARSVDAAAAFGYSLPKRHGRAPHLEDGRALAYSAILAKVFPADPEKTLALAKEAIGTGTLRLPILRSLFIRLIGKGDTRTAAELFAQILIFFPVHGAQEEDVLVLLDNSWQLAESSPKLVEQALFKAISALSEEGFEARNQRIVTTTHRVGERDVETESTRETLQLRAALQLRLLRPDLFSGYREKLEPMASLIAELDAREMKAALRPVSTRYRLPSARPETGFGREYQRKVAEAASLDTEQALATVEASADPNVKVAVYGILLDRSTGRGEESLRVADSALPAIEAMKAPFGIQLLPRLIQVYRNRQREAEEEKALELLISKTVGYCACEAEPGNAAQGKNAEGMPCDPKYGRYECVRMYESLARELERRPEPLREALSGKNPSIAARLLLAEL
ncbi:MAG: hypothetical protein IPM24_16220 [Bryobacterales bacterium]|nr:hypothetical protein [Bryobacterales bacterium]